MKVGDLKEFLAELPDDMECVVVGHFGEGNKMDLPRLRKDIPVGVGYEGWRKAIDRPPETVVEFAHMDIGEEPD
jgi:hypothetical protein